MFEIRSDTDDLLFTYFVKLQHSVLQVRCTKKHLGRYKQTNSTVALRNGHHIEQSMEQLGKVSRSWSAEQGKYFFPVLVRS